MKHPIRKFIIVILFSLTLFGCYNLSGVFPEWVHNQVTPVSAQQTNVDKLKHRANSIGNSVKQRKNELQKANTKQKRVNKQKSLQKKANKKISKFVPSLLPIFLFFIFMASSDI